MIETDTEKETALRLRRLIEKADISRSDRFLAERCLRRIEHPLRVTLFGTDPHHAISLLNLMIGQPVVSPSLQKARIQFFHAEVPHARVMRRDGTQDKVPGGNFAELFADNPTKVRIYVDLPVLKKVSFSLAAEADPASLCSDIDKTLPGADIAIWTGGPLGDPMREVWREIPDRLRDHSYLVPSHKMDLEPWAEIADEFVEVIPVDPRRAQEAKTRRGGVDKVTFRESGGAQIVKTIKKEIDLLVRSALDAAEVLLARFADQLEDPAGEAAPEVPQAPVAQPEIDQPVETQAAPPAPEPQPEPQPAPQPEPDLPEADLDAVLERVKSLPVPLREQVYSVPLGKLASRSRLLGTSGQGMQAKINQRTVSQAIKNMPKKTTRPVSKTVSAGRVKSRISRPVATPWSLGL